MRTEELEKLHGYLLQIYQSEKTADQLQERLMELGQRYRTERQGYGWVDEADIILITYGDSIRKEGRKHLETLHSFLSGYVGDIIKSVHILPMFPYTSDDGFSVVDYKQIHPDLGDWNEIQKMNGSYNLMFDAVINHISKSSEWFQGFLKGEEQYQNYFIVADPKGDYSKVTRPRAIPLLTAFDTVRGRKHVWTTFSEDQIDLNYENPQVLAEIIEVLLFYARMGARFIRLDAVGFMWKKQGTSCMHLDETHALIKIMRLILDFYVPGTILITETNVPHKDNISYFGNGFDEAGLVYQFPLPPLTMFSFLTEDATRITQWAKTLHVPSEKTTYFNFLASHDGIGVRPTEGILSEEERQLLVDAALKRGGRVSYKDNGDGTKSPYELNVNYQDALSDVNDTDEERINRFLAAQTILLSMQGVPGIYIHSLLGSRNDYYGVESTGINRRINREKLDVDVLEQELQKGGNRSVIFKEMLRRIEIRKSHTAFSPEAEQTVLEVGAKIFALCRHNVKTGEIIYPLINVSTTLQRIQIAGLKGQDLLNGEELPEEIRLEPLQARWVIKHNN